MIAGRVDKLLEETEVELVLPVATTKEKQLRFAWERRPSERFRMTWNQRMEPNSMFVNDVNDTGITVTVRWALMSEPVEKIAERLNRWLEQVEEGTYRCSGTGGNRL